MSKKGATTRREQDTQSLVAAVARDVADLGLTLAPGARLFTSDGDTLRRVLRVCEVPVNDGGNPILGITEAWIQPTEYLTLTATMPCKWLSTDYGFVPERSTANARAFSRACPPDADTCEVELRWILRTDETAAELAAALSRSHGRVPVAAKRVSLRLCKPERILRDLTDSGASQYLLDTVQEALARRGGYGKCMFVFNSARVLLFDALSVLHPLTGDVWWAPNQQEAFR